MRPALTALLLVLVTLAVPASADTLMTNHGFENGLTGWTQSHGTGGTAASTDQAWRGTASALLTDTSATEPVGLESGQVPVTAGTAYVAFAKVFPVSGRADLYLRFWSGAALLGSGFTPVSAPAGRWSDIQVKATAPAGATRASVVLYSANAVTGVTHWDEVAFTPEIANLGVQVENSTPNAVTFGTDAHRGVAYTVFTGTQDDDARFVAIDTATEKVVLSQPLEGATGGWAAATATDGSVYVGTYTNAGIYRHVQGTNTVTWRHKASGNQVWAMTPGRDGKIYGGTYPAAGFFKYREGSGYQDLGGVPVWPGKKYVRSIAYDDVADVTYLGTGSNAALIRFDNGDAQARKVDILPARFRDMSMVTSLKWTGGRLLARVEGTLLVFRMSGATATLEAEIPGTAPHLSDARDGKVYFVKGTALHAYDIAAKTEQPTGVDLAMEVSGFGWVDDTLVAVGGAENRARLFKYTPATGATRAAPVAGAPIMPAAINTIAGGPDGRIYSGAYLTGGMGVYEPIGGDGDDGRADLMHRGTISQTDGMLNHNGKLYIATYPGAKLYEQDPARPWAPRELLNLAGDEQSRPYALAGAPDGRVFIGTVPDYGRYDGALTVYDPATGGHRVHRDLIPDQSIVALAYHNGRVYGGSSIRGALGTTSARATATRFFVFDPATGAVAHQALPAAIAGKSTITDLTVVDGKIWGFAEGALFVFDPDTSRFLHVSEKFADVNPAYESSAQWRDADLRTVAKDPAHVYGTVGDRLFKIAKSNYALTTIVQKPANRALDGLATDDLGNIYYKIDGRLFRYAV
ncbi:hypothetical protein [Nonomuraea longicatena]|uniref:CBM-cenC domain-containing protein n=1 Tax=Nonomuraea longicatena TaxID=83682 RepID=A0ABP4B3C6_9ACTN